MGFFAVEAGGREVATWPRPSAKRLCELVLVSPNQRIGREAACELLFPNLEPEAAANALSKALSMARAALTPLGDQARSLFQADRGHIWVPPHAPLDVDWVAHEAALRSGVRMSPGAQRDEVLAGALLAQGVLLEDEPYADWALRPREALEALRQQARLELARDRLRGHGQSQPAAVAQAWEECISHDPACEEAAASLMRLYAAQGHHQLAVSTYDRCRHALEELGLRASPALDEARQAVVNPPSRPRRAGTSSAPDGAAGGPLAKEERRLVSVLFAELSGPAATGQRLDPEDLRLAVGDALAGVIAEVEGLGGTVTSVSGAGLAALFGAPEAHEDDPERAVRAGFRALSVARSSFLHAAPGALAPGALAPGALAPGGLSLRIGIETGPAIVGPLGTGYGLGYGAVGEVVTAAAALQSAAKAGSVLVGPATREACGDVFEWGPIEEVAPVPSAKPLAAAYLVRPWARGPGYRSQRRAAGQSELVGRLAELSLLEEGLREATSGTGSIALVVAEPGLGKTRLVQECRKRFMAWVGAGTGRLPLWLEGRCASFSSTTPYGLYVQLLSAWIGVTPEEAEERARPALERAMQAIFGGEVAEVFFLGHMMGLRSGADATRLARLSPEGLQRATFAAVKAVVARLASRGPTVLVLEDLHWADPISLRLTEELAALARDAPLFVLATRRPDPDPGTSALELSLEASQACPVRKVTLSPLSPGAERELARSLIGADAGDEVIGAVCANVEGNPFFLEERLSSLIETGALVRDGATWSLRASEHSVVPEALERLIRSRIDRLRPHARDAVVAAAVLGGEFSLSAVKVVTHANGELPAVMAELCTSGLLKQARQLPEPVYRFRHALIQETTYSGLLRAQRRELHARAAWGLEAAWSDRLEEVAAVLGRHYAAAGEAERAAHYLEVAGDRAASVFANDEAIASYRHALAAVGEPSAGARSPQASVALRAKLADVLWHTGRHAEARECLQEALAQVGPGDSYQAARLQATLGRVEVADHRYDAALAAFDAADGLLGQNVEGREQAVVDLWLEVQVDGRALLHYWRNQPDKARAALDRARPVVEARGSSHRKQSFYINLALQRARHDRYRIDEEMLANARLAVEAAAEGGDEHDLAWVVFCLGFLLLWHGDLAEAERHLAASLATVERVGDVVLRARCLCYLSLTALRRQDVQAVRALAPRALEAALAAAYPEYVATAKATMAWVAWQEDRYDEVTALADEALELWGRSVVSYSWYWVALWPLIAAHMRAGFLEAAIAAAQQLLVPPQQRLPEELEALVVAAVEAWDRRESEQAAGHLAGALELARRLRYA